MTCARVVNNSGPVSEEDCDGAVDYQNGGPIPGAKNISVGQSDIDQDDDGFPELPDPTFHPVDIGTSGGCNESNYVECFYARERLAMFSDTQIDQDQFTLLMMAVYFDVKNRHRTSIDRARYDTPFWDGGEEQGRACFGESCYGAAEVNYLAKWRLLIPGNTLIGC
jgi:hypothetical protein